MKQPPPPIPGPPNVEFPPNIDIRTGCLMALAVFAVGLTLFAMFVRTVAR